MTDDQFWRALLAPAGSIIVLAILDAIYRRWREHRGVTSDDVTKESGTARPSVDK